MANSNREFRKIPSLNFLYEVSKDGRSFRNVKSKKEKKILVDYHHSEKGYRYTFVNIKGHIQKVSITRVVVETFGYDPEDIKDHDTLNDTKKHVYLTNKEGEEIYFDSKTAVARALAEEYSTSIEHIRSKLKKKRSHIYGYDVRYDWM